MATIQDYEVSTVGAERKHAIPYARLEDTTPEVGHPALLLADTEGLAVGGMVVSLDADRSRAVIDFTPGKVYKCSVRNVKTYSGGAENTFESINIGDLVYYDDSPTMPSGVELSTSPLDSAGGSNSLWGHVVPMNLADEALYPKGTTTASTQLVGVIARGAGA